MADLLQFQIRMDNITYLRVACPSCTGHIEFPSQMRGHVINCPHCTLSMTLELAGAPPAVPPPANLYQRLRALNGLPTTPITINLPAAFRQQPESRP
jgi:hypothetical protein